MGKVDPRVVTVFSFVLMCFSIGFIGYFFERSSFSSVLILYGFAFSSLVVIYHGSGNRIWQLNELLIYSLLVRLVLLLATPSLSDDYFRYFYDGILIQNGINPFSYLPVQSISLISNEHADLANALFIGMNSKSYYSVYPPLHQALFYFATWGSTSVFVAVVKLRLLIIVADLAVIWFLFRLRERMMQDTNRVILYAFNPLVVLELTGNLHLEGVVLCFLMASLYFLGKSKFRAAGIFWAGAVGLKLVPIILAPIWWCAIQAKKRVSFFAMAFVIMVLAFLPLVFSNGFSGFFESVKLFQKSFEFNGSIYYFLRWIGALFLGYNPISILGPALSIFTILAIVVFVFNSPIWMPYLTLYEQVSLVYIFYFLCQPVVHPWYIIPLLGTSILTQMRSAIVWSFAVFLSYSAYSSSPTKEVTAFLIFQYAALLIFLSIDLYSRWRNERQIR